MEAMALHLESSYEKLYRWTQGKQFFVSVIWMCCYKDSAYMYSMKILLKFYFGGLSYCLLRSKFCTLKNRYLPLRAD